MSNFDFNDIEKMLIDKKCEIDKLKAPEGMEDRLRSALNKKSPKKNKPHKWIAKAAVVILAIIFIGNNIDTLAFYGGKIIGYDNVMSHYLKDINDMGRGQVLEESYVSKQGFIVMLDGVMLDDNQLIMFATVKDRRGNVDKISLESLTIKDRKGHMVRMSTSEGEVNKEKTEIKYKIIFESPVSLGKEVVCQFNVLKDENEESGEIKFNLDKKRAMANEFKKGVNKKIKVDETSIKVNSIVASPTTTYVHGVIQNIFELGKDEIFGGGFRIENLDLRLLCDGKEIKDESSQISTDMRGMTFSKNYEALPKDIKTLELKLVSVDIENRINEKIKLKEGTKNEIVEICGERVEINNVYKKDGDTFVTITTNKDTILSKVSMIMDKEEILLEETSSSKDTHGTDGSVKSTRTLCFKGSGDDLILKIERLKYKKVYNKTIDI